MENTQRCTIEVWHPTEAPKDTQDTQGYSKIVDKKKMKKHMDQSYTKMMTNSAIYHTLIKMKFQLKKVTRRHTHNNKQHQHCRSNKCSAAQLKPRNR